MSTALAQLSTRLQVSESELQNIVVNTVMPNGGKTVTAEQFTSFIAVANEYGLNPLTKEIYAFPTQGGGIQPIVSIDGWLRIINTHPDFNGMTFEDARDDSGLTAVTCNIFKKGIDHPVQVTEYMDECKMGTQPWKKYPARMLRHKATIQCARYAFGLAGIVDPDEADRLKDCGVIEREVEAVVTIDESQVTNIIAALELAGMTDAEFCQKVRIENIESLAATRYDGAIDFLKAKAITDKGEE